MIYVGYIEELMWFLWVAETLMRNRDICRRSISCNRQDLSLDEIYAKFRKVCEEYHMIPNVYDTPLVQDYQLDDFFPLYDEVKGLLNRLVEYIIWAAEDEIEEANLKPEDVTFDDAFLLWCKNRSETPSVIHYGTEFYMNPLSDDKAVRLQKAKWFLSRLQHVHF